MIGERIEVARAVAHFEKVLLPLALAEDVGDGDVTSLSVLPDGAKGRAVIEAKDDLTLCGLPCVDAVFRTAGSKITLLRHLAKDGDEVKRGQVVFEVEGEMASLLTLERTALNVLQRLSGIASRTKAYVGELAGTRIKLLDTRKTIAGWRLLEKYAVSCGGGWNHRMGLYDQYLIKDNHIEAAGSLSEAVRRARAHQMKTRSALLIEVECQSLEQVSEAVACGADVIMLDNLDDSRLRQAVAMIGRKAKIEVSGNVTQGRLCVLSRLDIDFISSGGITHSAPSKDLSLTVKARAVVA